MGGQSPSCGECDELIAQRVVAFCLEQSRSSSALFSVCLKRLNNTGARIAG